jgi:hypothetical protein
MMRIDLEDGLAGAFVLFLIFVACAFCYLCWRDYHTPPSTVCIRSHEETSTTWSYMFDGKGNITGMIPMQSTSSVCDEDRPITAAELAAWHREHD